MSSHIQYYSQDFIVQCLLCLFLFVWINLRRRMTVQQNKWRVHVCTCTCGSLHYMPNSNIRNTTEAFNKKPSVISRDGIWYNYMNNTTAANSVFSFGPLGLLSAEIFFSFACVHCWWSLAFSTCTLAYLNRESMSKLDNIMQHRIRHVFVSMEVYVWLFSCTPVKYFLR